MGDQPTDTPTPPQPLKPLDWLAIAVGSALFMVVITALGCAGGLGYPS